MGADWFIEKLRTYKEVRRKVVQSGDNTDLMAELEIQRFREDEERMKRMKDRDQKIRQETSQLRKVILQARQFADEFS